MAIATFKDLCIDVDDLEAMTQFWAGVLGLDVREDPEGDFSLTGPTSAHTVWPCRVPEPKTVKNRVHLDVFATSLQPFEGLPRLSVEGEFPWTVLVDPEGGEFCVFVRDDVADYRLYELGIDCANPTMMATWWADVLGANLVHDESGYSYVEEIPQAPFDSMDFVPVPEPKTVKNRIHWDLTVAPGGIEELQAIGATVLRRPDEEIEWTVMGDPEGNEFCAFVVQ